MPKKNWIDIDPKNKGAFDETKRRTGKTTDELLNSPNKKTRERAQFAKNMAEIRKKRSK